MDSDNLESPKPLPPADPSLVSNPVPHTRDRETYSVGPGAVAGAEINFHTLEELRKLGDPNYDYAEDEIYQLLKVVERDQARITTPADLDLEPLSDAEKDEWREKLRDRTWGFFVFVTDYSPAAREALPIVLEKLVACTRLWIESFTSDGTPDALTQEAVNRFRLEIVKDQKTLANASLGRVREELLALIRARRPDCFPGNIMPPGPVQNRACLVLDSDTISRKSRMDVPSQYDPTDPEGPREMEIPVLKVVDGSYQRYEDEEYHGWKMLSMTDLPTFYRIVGQEANSGAIEDLWSAKGTLTYPLSSLPQGKARSAAL